MNNVILIGNLTADPEMRYSSAGKAVSRFTLAITRDKENTDYIQVVTFNNTAEAVNRYLRKGSKAAISGRIQSGSYTNKEGQKVYTTDVIAASVEFLSQKQEAFEKFEGSEEWQY